MLFSGRCDLGGQQKDRCLLFVELSGREDFAVVVVAESRLDARFPNVKEVLQRVLRRLSPKAA